MIASFLWGSRYVVKLQILDNTDIVTTDTLALFFANVAYRISLNVKDLLLERSGFNKYLTTTKILCNKSTAHYVGTNRRKRLMSPIVVTSTFVGLFDTLVVFPGSFFANTFRISN